MIHSLKCPSCAAPVDYDENKNASIIRCPFCSNSVVVPESMRTHTSFAASDGHSGGRRWMLVLGVILVFVVGSLILAGGIINTLVGSITRKADPPPTMPRIATRPVAPPSSSKASEPAGIARTLLAFGGEGTGPGLFTDARSIALDGEGRIYVGDYTGGRIQVFDPDGKFLTQWMVNPKMPLRGLAASRQGTVYVVQSGEITRYEGQTGKSLGKLAYAEGWGFDDVTVAADGSLVTAWYKGRDNIVRFNPDGTVGKIIREAISGQSGDSELNTRVAVDGLGNIYALGSFNEAVFKYTPDGKYVSRFGGKGAQPGQFRAVQSIAVDGQGRIYVGDIKGVQIFDADGRYIDTFKTGGIAFAMVFNDKNELFVANRTKVLKLALDVP